MEMTPISCVMLLRLNILPPYCADCDEGERDESDYRSYYEERVSECLIVTKDYSSALAEFGADVDSGMAFQNVLACRQAFIGKFPFARDEFDPDDQLALKRIRETYSEDLKKGQLMEHLRAYQSALTQMT